MQLTEWIEIFAMATGILYVLLEIFQKNAMWVVGIATGAACAWSFAVQSRWGMMLLNGYYVIVSLVGIVKWRRDGEALGEGAIHLRPLSSRTALWSAAAFVILSLLLTFLLRLMGDGDSLLDGMATVLSVIATWWLSESYLEEWILWIVADLMTALLCLLGGQYYLSLLYLVDVGSAVYGYFHWKKKGILIS